MVRAIRADPAARKAGGTAAVRKGMGHPPAARAAAGIRDTQVPKSARADADPTTTPLFRIAA